MGGVAVEGVDRRMVWVELLATRFHISNINGMVYKYTH